MNNAQAIEGIVLCFIIAFSAIVLPSAIRELNSEMDALYVVVNHIDIVTDKWVKSDTAFWVFGNKDVFIIEINNDFTKEVSDKTYYNTNIGDYNNWTTKELRYQGYV